MNRLQHETSPYLLQHAENPVDWYPWGEEAFEIAKKENKPVLVSIGYSSCHWCHVMAHESFESEETAALMNELFVCVKVDREEYPDVDHVYMNAVQAMTGSGGWPLNVFVLPDKRPFFGGTYFPPVRAYNRASWREVLINISQYFTQNNDEVLQQADQLTKHLEQLALPKAQTGGAEVDWDDNKMVDLLLANADKESGGFGGAPKFPGTFALNLLWQCGLHANREDAVEHVLLSLEKMARGGIYDHLRGGFARYSTDRHWFAPHFEKMLYDNALLLPLYAKAWHETRKPLFWQVITETLAWLEQEMSVVTPEGTAFFSAQDADSEGVEGLYYTWTADELKAILGDDYPAFAAYYGVEEEGNWEHRNILYTTNTGTEIPYAQLESWKKILLSERYKRIPPLCDDKVLLGWNALMNKALQEVYVFTDIEQAKNLALDNMRFLLHTFKSDNTYWHTWKNGEARITAYADDLAYWAEALVGLGHMAGEERYYREATEIVRFLKQFYHREGHVLYEFTHIDKQALGIPHRDTYDGAVPSANAVLSGVLYALAYLEKEMRWEEEAKKMLEEVKTNALRHPSSFANWLQVYRNVHVVATDMHMDGTDVINAYSMVRKQTISGGFRFQIAPKQGQSLQISVCQHQVCHKPVKTISEAMGLTF